LSPGGSKDLGQGFPEPQSPIADRQLRVHGEASVFEIKQEFLPGLFTFAVAVLDRQEFLLPVRGRPDHDQHTMVGFVHPDIEMDAIGP